MSAHEPQNSEYRFGRCLVRVATRELLVGGSPVQTEPRVLNLLIFLIEKRDRVVGKEELLNRLWDGAAVTDSALAQAILKARKAIGEEAGDTSVIRTVNRIGYRFIAPVDTPISGLGTAEPSMDSRMATGASLGVDTLALLRARPPQALVLFAPDEDVALWESALEALQGTERLEALVPLAWHLRQRDTRRAQALAREAQALLDGLPAPLARSLGVRLALVVGEAQWLLGSLDAGRDVALQARAAFATLEDPVGQADASLLLMEMAEEAGYIDEAIEHGCAVGALLSGGEDPSRFVLSRLMLARCSRAYNRALASPREEDDAIASAHASQSLWLQAFAEDAEAGISFIQNDYKRCVEHCLKARDTALVTGALRLAIACERRAGACLANVQEDEAALELNMRTLERVRALEWPFCLGAVLVTCGIGLVRSDRLQDAEQLLNTAQDFLRRHERSREYCLLLGALAALYVKQNKPQAAVDTSRRQGQLALKLGLARHRLAALAEECRALLLLGRAAEAQQIAWRALSSEPVGTRPYKRYEFWRTLAEVHRTHALPCPEGLPEQGTVLYCLAKAREAITSMPGRRIPLNLLEAIAAEHAREGNPLAAYEVLTESIALRSSLHSEVMRKHAATVKFHQGVDQLLSQKDYQQALAATHAQRAESLAQKNATLERLLLVGTDIARLSDIRAISDALSQHGFRLLAGWSLAVFLLNENDGALEQVTDTHGDVVVEGDRVSSKDPVSAMARCAREQREVDSANGCDKSIFVPLVSNGRLLGVLAASSQRPDAYDERDRLVLRSLCAFGSIALDHALALKERDRRRV